MKAPHVLRVSAPAEAFAPLFAAGRAAGLRVGWLEAEAVVPPLEEGSAGEEGAAGAGGLLAAARGGALRTVRVETTPGGAGARVLSAKHLTGAPVFRDLLREHFLGCRLLLVHGESALIPAGLPRLEALPSGSAGAPSWRLSGLAGPEAEAGEAPSPPLDLTTDQLLARLRRPRPA